MRLPFDCPMDHVLNTPSFFGDFVDGKEMPNALGDRYICLCLTIYMYVYMYLYLYM